MSTRLPLLLPIVALAGMMVVSLRAETTPIDGNNHQQDWAQFDRSFDHGDEQIHVTITKIPFHAQEHRISKKHWKIDGTTPIGVDGFEVSPKSGIGDFKITWNGHEIPVPRELYSDCYSPNLAPSDPARYRSGKRKSGEFIAEQGTMLRWNDVSNELDIIMVSFEWASAPYSMIWHVTPHGVRSREGALLGS
jgi:hypothetical protein